MCLQTYLYYYCATLLYALDTFGDNSRVRYGMCCIQMLCDRWVRFFMPCFLSNCCVQRSGSVVDAFAQVKRTHRAISVLEERCKMAAQARTDNDLFDIKYHYGLLRCALQEVILPELKAARYDKTEGITAFHFKATDSFLTSFAPVSGSSCLDNVPGVYSEAEQQVVQFYFDIVKRSPTIAHLAGILVGAELTADAVTLRSISDFRERYDVMEGMASFRPETERGASLYNHILEQWL